MRPSHCYEKTLDKSTLGKEEFTWLTVLSPWEGMAGGVAAGASKRWSRGICSQEERDACWCSACFLLFINSGTPVQRMVSPPHEGWVFFHLHYPNLDSPILTDTLGDCRVCQVDINHHSHRLTECYPSLLLLHSPVSPRRSPPPRWPPILSPSVSPSQAFSVTVLG